MAFFTDTEIEAAIGAKAPGTDLDFARHFLKTVDDLRHTYPFPLVYRHALNRCEVWNKETREKLCSLAGKLYGARGSKVAQKNKVAGKKSKIEPIIPETKSRLRGRQYELII